MLFARLLLSPYPHARVRSIDTSAAQAMPVGGGCAAVLNAIADAVGDEVFCRAPVKLDTILASIEAGRPMQDGLRGHI